MKKYLLILATFLLSSVYVFAQDIILKQDGSEIKAKVLEITDQQVKYKEFDFQNEPTRNINISDVFMITYENGQKEVFKKQSSTSMTFEKAYNTSSSDHDIPKIFRLTTETLTTIIDNSAIDLIDNSTDLCLHLEDELLNMKFKVVPYKVAKDNARITDDTKAYIPASIEISVSVAQNFKIEYVFKVIDLSNNQLLTVFRYDFMNWRGMKIYNQKAVKQFSEDLSRYL